MQILNLGIKEAGPPAASSSIICFNASATMLELLNVVISG